MGAWWPNWRLSLRLQNTSSVARDHLANERTFLAWLRTSLTFASVGVAMTQLFRLTSDQKDHFTYHFTTAIGSLFVGLGILIVIMGCVRFFHVQSLLQEGLFPAARITILVSFLFSFGLIVVALALLIEMSKRAPFSKPDHPATRI